MNQRSGPSGRLEPEHGGDPGFLCYQAMVALESVCEMVGLLLQRVPAEGAVDALNNLAGVVDFVAAEIHQAVADAVGDQESGA